MGPKLRPKKLLNCHWSVGASAGRPIVIGKSFGVAHSLGPSVRPSCQDGARLTFVVGKIGERERERERLKRDSSLIVAEEETEKRGGSFAFSRQRRNQSPPREVT